MVEQVPKGRFVHTSEIAAMVAWLCSEECSFSTGQLFDISGGQVGVLDADEARGRRRCWAGSSGDLDAGQGLS